MSAEFRRFLIFPAFCFALAAWAQSPSQPAAATSSANDLNTRIVNNVRGHFKVPAQVKIEVGAPHPSELPGYDGVTVTLVNGDRRSPYDFYISKDGKTLAQVNKLDVSQDPFSSTGRPSRGPADAKVTVVVFDDFQCPYCAEGYKTLFNEIEPEYKDKIRIIYKDFPLSEIHPWAIHAAVDANCLFAQSNDAYWDFAGYVHTNQKDIRGENRPLDQQFAALDSSALDTGSRHNLDQKKLEACVKGQDAKDVLASEKYGEETLGIDATPTMYVNGTRLDGAVPAPDLKQVLDAALREAGVAPPAQKEQNAGTVKVTPDNAAVQNVLKSVQGAGSAQPNAAPANSQAAPPSAAYKDSQSAPPPK